VGEAISRLSSGHKRKAGAVVVKNTVEKLRRLAERILMIVVDEKDDIDG